MTDLSPNAVDRAATTRHFKPKANGHDRSRAARADDAAPAKLLLLQSASTIAIEVSTRYLLKGLIHAGDLSVWYGPSGCGKTFLGLNVAHALATGREVFGRRVRQCRVALFSLEGSAGLAKRLTAVQSEFGAAPDLFVHRGALSLFRNEPMVQSVIATIKDCGAELVIIDTLSRAMSGADENAPNDMTHMVGVFDRIRSETGCHVMIVHHTGKDESRGSRGHSSLRAAVDVEVEVSAGEGGERAARVSKGRDDADGQVYAFRLKQVALGIDDDGDTQTTCVIEESGLSQRVNRASNRISKGDKQALGWLREAVEEHGQQAPEGLPNVRVTTKEIWMMVARKRTGEMSDEALRKAIARAITNLSVSHLVGVHHPHFWVIK